MLCRVDAFHVPNVTTTPPPSPRDHHATIPAGDNRNKHPSHANHPWIGPLRAHDERAVEMLVVPQESVQRTPAGPSYLGAEPAESEEDQRALIRFGTHRGLP